MCNTLKTALFIYLKHVLGSFFIFIRNVLRQRTAPLRALRHKQVRKGTAPNLSSCSNSLAWSGFTWADPTFCVWQVRWGEAAAPQMSNAPLPQGSQLDLMMAAEIVEKRACLNTFKWSEQTILGEETARFSFFPLLFKIALCPIHKGFA